jgi:threonyl-tRNA synthetase
VIGRLATRPLGITPEKVISKEGYCENCVAALVCVERRDSIVKAHKIAKEILKMCKETYDHDVVLLPFAHLSNKLAPDKEAIAILDVIEADLRANVKVLRAHFGSHKELLIHLYGHPGNARYREF